jgi:hypothetical protein|tara:strand:+ start:1791 stop:2327 length:537 start_codon:yes stop_codon:yes gene_type:complete
MSKTDERVKKSVDEGRANRAMVDRAHTESREVTENERVEMFRQQLFQSSLPDLPEINGWHTCWLTTTNPRDSIQGRIRLGYEPVKPEDVPGWEYAALKTGDWQGFIGVNEMLAFKLPMSLYEKYMMEAHHDAPLREESKLTDTADFLKQQAEGDGSSIAEGDGNKSFGEKRQGRFDLV